MAHRTQAIIYLFIIKGTANDTGELSGGEVHVQGMREWRGAPLPSLGGPCHRVSVHQPGSSPSSVMCGFYGGSIALA